MSEERELELGSKVNCLSLSLELHPLQTTKTVDRNGEARL